MLECLLLLCVLSYVPDAAGDLASQESKPELKPGQKSRPPVGDLGDDDFLSANLEAELRDLKNQFAKLPKEEQRRRVQGLAASTGGYRDLVSLEGGFQDLGSLAGGFQDLRSLAGGFQDLGNLEGGYQDLGSLAGGYQDLASLAGGYQDLGRLSRPTIPPNWSSFPTPYNPYCPCATQPQTFRPSWPPASAPETSSPLYMKKIKQPYPQNKRRRRRSEPIDPTSVDTDATEGNNGAEATEGNIGAEATEGNTKAEVNTDHQNLLERPTDPSQEEDHSTPLQDQLQSDAAKAAIHFVTQQTATYPQQIAYYPPQTAYYPAPQQIAYYPPPPMPREELNKFHRNWFYDLGDDWETSDILRAHNPFYQTQEMLREEMDHYAYPLHWGNINLGKYSRPDLVTPAQHAFGPGYDFNSGDLSHVFHFNPSEVL